jgi:hypothetical protein
VAPRPPRRRTETGNLLVSTSDYVPADITAAVTQLPPGCATAPIGSCGTAVADGNDFPSVFNNDSVDAFFGVTSPVYLDELTPRGEHVATIPVPTDQFVTSFSSKSELALNLSPEGRYVSFMGYVAKPGAIDVSNANTPGVIDPGNGDVGPYYRVVAQLEQREQIRRGRPERLDHLAHDPVDQQPHAGGQRQARGEMGPHAAAVVSGGGPQIVAAQHHKRPRRRR